MKWNLLLICSALTSLSFHTTADAATFERDDAYMVTPEEVADYRSRTGASIGDAIASLEREALASAEVDAIRESYSDRMAGLYWQPYPDQQVVIRLTGTEPVASRVIRTPAGPVTVKFVTGADVTLRALNSRLRDAMPRIVDVFPALRGGWVDERSGRVILDVGLPAEQSPSHGSKMQTVSKLLKSDVELRFDRPGANGPPKAEKTGGQDSRKDPTVPLSTTELPAVGGGRQLTGGVGQYCTAGFAVRHVTSNARGVLTAGHCPNDLVYMSYPLANETVPAIVLPVELESEYWGAANDFNRIHFLAETLS